MKRLRRVLPHSWVDSLQVDLNAVMATLPQTQRRLQGSADTFDERMAVLRAASAGQTAVQAGPTCSGCGQRAIGLQRCARCKQAACELG